MSRRRAAALLAVSSLALTAVARAETLQDALRDAYASSPALASARAAQAALGETVAQARAAGLPTASLTLSSSYERTDLGAASGGQVVSAAGGLVASAGGTRVESNAGQAQIALAQPLYTGGRVTWAVRTARARVEAGDQGLRATAQQVVADAVSAYADMLQAQEVLAVRRADLATLERQRANAAARFREGQVTRTDVAQAQAQEEAARAALAAGDAGVEMARAAFVAAVGRPPGSLEPADALPGAPATLDAAFDAAEAGNPLLAQSRATERASQAAVRLARANYGPSVSLQAGLGYVGPVSPLAARDYDRDVTAGVVLTQPIFTGGLVASQVRQARAQADSDRLNVETTRRQVVRDVSQAWSALLSARAGVTANTAQVAAAGTALEGAQAEYAYALRTTLDVLIADQTLRAAQLALAQSRHDALVAQAMLLTATGGLTDVASGRLTDDANPTAPAR